MPRNTLQVHARKISGSESLVGGRSRNHRCRRIFPSPPVPCLNCGDGDRWCRYLLKSLTRPISMKQFTSVRAK
ncbi:hypothetical protein TNCV_138751 [Trichonephila clavipes]|nr:hypothetical protein TNCV_138751 [Trichonephila clavipes]